MEQKGHIHTFRSTPCMWQHTAACDEEEDPGLTFLSDEFFHSMTHFVPIFAMFLTAFFGLK